MLLGHHILNKAAFDLHPTGESSKKFLALMNEPFDVQIMERLKKSADNIQKKAIDIPWRKDLQTWPPHNLQNFSSVAFYRMFPSSTHRGQQGAEQELSSEEQTLKHAQWAEAHVIVQKYIEDELHPTFERIQLLNKVFGHTIRTQPLKKRFPCFDPVDIPEAIQYFDIWYQSHQGKVWPAQLATLAAVYLLDVHPFENGNGRTARFVVDWILQLYNLPPASFFDRFQALLARSTEVWDTPHHVAVNNILMGVTNTLNILQNPNYPT